MASRATSTRISELNVLGQIFRRQRQIPIVLQAENAECGVACMVMIGCYYGHDINLLGLRSSLGLNLSERGASLHQLIVIAEKLSMQSRALKLEVEGIPNLVLPAILHWNLNHYVVLKSISKKGYEIIDPATGYRLVSHKELNTSFTGIALEITPKPDFKPIEVSKRLRFNIFSHGQDHVAKGIWRSLGLSLIMLFLAMIMPIIMQTIFDDVIPSRDSNFLSTIALTMVTIGLLRIFMSYVRSQLTTSLGANLSLSYGTALFSHLLALPSAFFEKRHIGDIVSRFRSFGQIRNFLVSGLTDAIVDGIMSFLTVIFMCFYSIKLALLSLFILALYTAIRLIAYPALRALSAEAQMRQAKENSNFLEAIRGIQSIKLYAGEVHRRSTWQALYTASLNTELLISGVENRFQLLNQSLFTMERVLVIFLGVGMIFEGDLTPGMLIAFLSYKDQFATRVSSLVDSTIRFKMLSVQMDQIADIVLTEADQLSSSAELAGDIEGHVRVNDISFRYDEDSPWILKNLSLTVHAGEHVAIIGPSGQGKTTLLKAILGFLKMDDGEVTIDNYSVRKHGRAVQKYIATVMQDDQLMSGTIADNIALFDPDPDQARIEYAAKCSAIFDEINQMPMGFLSLVGDMGSALSGGQKQRIMIARALYKRPRVLLMDEATSHLDLRAESIINSNIKSLNITRIVIAHRRETILSASRIFRVNKGEIVEISKQEFEQMKEVSSAE